jgi:protein-S-isoprenylcysteine O-methyltransferase Ste14
MSAVNGRRERFIASLGLISAAIIFGFCLLVEAPYPFDRRLTRWLGFALVAGGMVLVLWAVTYIGKAFSGEISPVLDHFVVEGPYRLVRHPVYLGLTTALVGVALAFDNWLGTLAVFGLFLPSQIIRARLEEATLAARFGMSYEIYRRRTGFMLPKLVQ